MWLDPPEPTWEGEIDVECSAKDVKFKVVWAYSSQPLELTGACPFAGTVEAMVFDGMLQWECPVCGTEYSRDPRADEEPEEPEEPWFSDGDMAYEAGKAEDRMIRGWE